MADKDPPEEQGSLLIAALLLLGLLFAGLWIDAYVKTGGRPWQMVSWFGAMAAVIVVGGLALILRRGRGNRRP